MNKFFSLALAAVAITALQAPAHAGAADAPTIVEGSTVRGIGVAKSINAQGTQGSSANGNGSIGISNFSIGGGFSRSSGTLPTDVAVGRVDINTGSRVTGSTVEATGTATDIVASGATVHVGGVRIGGTY